MIERDHSMPRLFHNAPSTSRRFHLTRLVHVHLTDLGSIAYHMRLLTCHKLSGIQNIYAFNHVLQLLSRFKRLELHREVLFYLCNVLAVSRMEQHLVNPFHNMRKAASCFFQINEKFITLEQRQILF